MQEEDAVPPAAEHIAASYDIAGKIRGHYQ